MSSVTLDSATFKQAMRLLAGAVTVISTEHLGRRAGLTATAVCSLSADPPRLLICINRAAEAYPVIMVAKRFCVNVLAHDQVEVATRFAGLDGTEGEARFTHCRWSSLTTGAPVLDGGLVTFDCVVADVMESGTHGIIIGDVKAVRGSDRRDPLVYMDGSFDTLAHTRGEEPEG